MARTRKLLLLLLLCALGQASARGKPTWEAQRLPAVLPRATLPLAPAAFAAEARLEVRSPCGPQCHQRSSPPSPEQLAQYLSYETLYSNGQRTETSVGVFDPGPDPAVRVRARRQIYGHDSRFSISGAAFLLHYPFSTSVKLSTGCTGTLVSERHVLTAAHCIHDGQTYVKGTQKLRVGFLRPRGKEGANASATGPGRPAQPRFQWIRVKRTQVPKGWIQGGANDVGMDYDYALLELRRPHRRAFMQLGVSPPARRLPGGRVHFSGFDNDRPGALLYRFCPVQAETRDLLYQRCDARPGASGSGVYVRMWRRPQRRWQRKVIGVFSGHQWVDVNGAQQDFNVAVRITPLKYAQICYWIKGNYLDCREG